MCLINAPCSFMKKNTHTQLYLELKSSGSLGHIAMLARAPSTLISKNGIQQDTPHPPTQIGLFVILSWPLCCSTSCFFFLFFLEWTPDIMQLNWAVKSLCAFGLKLSFLLLLISINVSSGWKCLHLKMMINNTEKKNLKWNELSSMWIIKLQWINNFQHLINWTRKKCCECQISSCFFFFAFPSVIPADYRICITRWALLHIHTDTHTHNISRKVSIAATAMTINTFCVGQRVDPLKNESF